MTYTKPESVELKMVNPQLHFMAIFPIHRATIEASGRMGPVIEKYLGTYVSPNHDSNSFKTP